MLISTLIANNSSLSLTFLFSLLIGFTLLLLVVFLFLAYSYYQQRKEVSHLRKKLEAKLDTSSIYDDNYFALLFFDEKGELQYINESFRNLFHLQEPPADLDAFLSEYGDDNGMRSAHLIGNTSYVTTISLDSQYIHLEFRRFLHNEKLYTSFIAYDVTEREKRQEHARQFVANVSHELKTPLTTIKLNSESLLDWGLEGKTPETIGGDISRIYEECLRMERLVNDLSLLTSIDSQGISPLMQEISLDPLIRSVIDRCRFEANNKEIQIEFSSRKDMPLIFAEKSSIERIITNLLTNAIKYTPKLGMVKIYLNYVRDEIYIKVSDTGIGIAPEHIHKIFDRFYRVDKTGSVLFGGTGLGLAIAKDLAELNGCRIEVQSKLGQGSDFFLFLPTAKSVYMETLKAYAILHPLDTVLYRQAANFLLDLCAEIMPYRSSLSAITEEEIASLIEYACPPDLLQETLL